MYVSSNLLCSLVLQFFLGNVNVSMFSLTISEVRQEFPSTSREAKGSLEQPQTSQIEDSTLGDASTEAGTSTANTGNPPSPTYYPQFL